MIVPALLTVAILGAVYATRTTSPRAVAAAVKQFEVIVNADKYNSNAPGTVGKSAQCANNPACDAQAALLDLGYTNTTYLGSDDPDLSRFRQGRAVSFAFDVRGELRPDREPPPWMTYFPRTPSTTARFQTRSGAPTARGIFR